MFLKGNFRNIDEQWIVYDLLLKRYEISTFVKIRELVHLSSMSDVCINVRATIYNNVINNSEKVISDKITSE